MINTKEIKVLAADGYELSATLRVPIGEPIGFAQINSGTGIPQKFYRHLANYLSKNGYVTVTFDYRGIGKSKPITLKGFEATNLQWGELDMSAILEWGIRRYPNLEKTVIGHSMGGQLIGKMKNADKIDRTFLIASGTGFWKDMPNTKLKILMPILWYIFIPFTTIFCGFGAAKKIKQGENLPKGVALQWRNWCINKNYWESDSKDGISTHSFAFLKGKLKSISFTDDNIISEKSNNDLLKYYINVNLETERISPVKIGLSKIGHFGFFSPKSEKLWNLIA